MILDLHKLLHNRQTWAGRGSSRPRALEEYPRTTLLRHLISLLCQSADFSPDSPSPPRKGAWLACSEFLHRFWVLEVFWCFVGLGCAAAIIVVLAQYDRQQAPQWPLGITLNTLLAFLASTAKAALLIPVTEGIGQLRWMWFRRTARQADDFELFEEATRGSYGSLKLMISLKGGCVAYLRF